MSVHGQVKVRTSAEQKAARERERAEKLRLYSTQYENILNNRQLMDSFNLLKQTENILVDHPDCFTLWNIRRESIVKLENGKQKEYLEKELQVTQMCLKSNSKSYSCWYQRQWCLKQLKEKFNLNLYQNELELCKKYLEYDERNFHCWAYRYYLLERLCPSSTSELEPFYENELSFLRSTIGINLSNYSAWHYRSKYLDKLLDHNPSHRSTLLSTEWQLVLSAVYTDCSDQAAWFYARWLLFKQLGIQLISEDEHIKPLEELDELESGNKWCMLALCQLWKGKTENNDKRINYLEQLANRIDPDREQFYRDQI
ncbi:unnamed protein product [Rotaria magnacalcarata]|uniref:Geranylgeranyl transferase type-2 subunit alpha n=1 Tax=Rotaria magnacalcarata TaxID=392030 RepID=A0A816UZM1_9BILA|nr:unnamed protein product [Rotaria magnacalcarata]CAF1505694.1 unnamed protein product [Rotaria magnacalcarata]CAF2048010.1 unnamed protein product [Rotaria magnacalcarata]CAF2120639.1 unnamed protein product [Rotaria magnacalcarata]CAF2122531.1 unnamed protein product [Rotaria magnacalcarata]